MLVADVRIKVLQPASHLNRRFQNLHEELYQAIAHIVLKPDHLILIFLFLPAVLFRWNHATCRISRPNRITRCKIRENKCEKTNPYQHNNNLEQSSAQLLYTQTVSSFDFLCILGIFLCLIL